MILHELCHLAIRGHGREFVALLDRFMPNWREVRMRLNEAPLDFTIEDQMSQSLPQPSALTSVSSPSQPNSFPIT